MEHVSYMHSDITAGRKWLMQMGAGAQKHGLTIQYCMARSWNVMQALEIPVVTQVRGPETSIEKQFSTAFIVRTQETWTLPETFVYGNSSIIIQPPHSVY